MMYAFKILVLFSLLYCIPSISTAQINITTFSGSGATGSGNGGFADGLNTAARFSQPIGITVDSNGLIYIADQGNQRIRIVTADSTKTFAGDGQIGLINGAVSQARFKNPSDIAFDSSGRLFIADNGNNTIRVIDLNTLLVTTIAGNPSPGNADGSGVTARFDGPHGITIDSNGTLYIADGGNHRIRKIIFKSGVVSQDSAVVTTIAGSTAGFADGIGTNAQFNQPLGVTVASSGELVVSERLGRRIRKINVNTLVVTTLAGTGSTGFTDGPGNSATFDFPEAVAFDHFGDLYIPDRHRLRKVTFNNGTLHIDQATVSTVTGENEGYVDGADNVARFRNIAGIGIHQDGDIIVSDHNNQRIRKISGAVPSLDPIAYFPFNGNANDESGNGNHGVVSGAILTTDRLGAPDRAYQFDDIDDFIQTQYDMKIQSGNNFSLSCWFRVNTDVSGDHILGAGLGSFHTGLGVAGGKLWAQVRNGGNEPSDAFGNTQLSINTWYHAAYVVEGTDVQFYLNGIADGSGTLSMQADPANNARIGSRDDTHSIFGGAIDDVRLFDRALSASEVAALATTSPDPVTVSLGMDFGAAGDTLCVPVTLTNPNTLPVGGLQFDVINSDTTSAKFKALADTSAHPGFSFTANTLGDTTRVVVHSASGAVIQPGTDLALLTLKYCLTGTAALGSTIDLTLAAVEVGDTSGVAFPDSAVSGTLNVGIRGDVNLDGRVSILDVIKLVRILVGKDATPAVGTTAFKIADADANSTIDVADVVTQINRILGIQPKSIASAPSGPAAVTLGVSQTGPDGVLAVPVYLSPDGLPAGMQMNFSYDPTKMRLEAPVIGSGQEGLLMDYHIEDGMLRLIIYTMQPGRGITTGNDPLVWIPVGALSDQAAGRLTLTDITLVDASAQHMPVTLDVPSVAVGKEGGPPTVFSLSPARPNPFNPRTTIAYEVPQQAHVTLTVYNLLGQQVVRLVDSVKLPGRYEMVWTGVNAKGQSVASGVYMYRITTDAGFTQNRRMTLLK